LAKSSEDGVASLLVVGCGALIDVDDLTLEGPVNQDSQLASGGGDDFGLADTERESAKECTEGRLRSAETLCCKA
jgi:hypothetical protein